MDVACESHGTSPGALEQGIFIGLSETEGRLRQGTETGLDL
jgi:hypothetical protein